MAGWVTGSLAPRTGAENNVRDRAKVLAEATRAIAAAAAALAVEAERVYDREQAANARIADASKLLWHWIAGVNPSGRDEHPYVDHEATVFELAQGMMRLRLAKELATVLGEDISPENVQYELFKRRQSEPPLAIE